MADRADVVLDDRVDDPVGWPTGPMYCLPIPL